MVGASPVAPVPLTHWPSSFTERQGILGPEPQHGLRSPCIDRPPLVNLHECPAALTGRRRALAGGSTLESSAHSTVAWVAG